MKRIDSLVEQSDIAHTDEAPNKYPQSTVLNQSKANGTSPPFFKQSEQPSSRPQSVRISPNKKNV